jgi:hypothetical protein
MGNSLHAHLAVVVLNPSMNLITFGFGAQAQHALIGAFKHRFERFESKRRQQKKTYYKHKLREVSIV